MQLVPSPFCSRICTFAVSSGITKSSLAINHSMAQITYYGHSCFGFATSEGSFLVDPFITPNEKAAHVDVRAIKADQIFLTHGHQDHMADVESIAAQNEGCLVLTNFELANLLAEKGLETIGMNFGGIWTQGSLQAKLVPALHSSSTADGQYAGNPGGWVFKLEDGKSIYVAGDTCLDMNMKTIPLTCGQIDLAILPIGGLFTMHSEEAVLAAEFVGTDTVIGCHYDTFPPIQIDHAAAKAVFKKQGLSLHLLEIGGHFDI